jgi:hypothetical protein
MNSLGVKPRVNYLYTDLYDGLVIFQVWSRSERRIILHFQFQLMDFIKPGVVDWKRVKKAEQLSKMQAKANMEVTTRAGRLRAIYRREIAVSPLTWSDRSRSPSSWNGLLTYSQGIFHTAKVFFLQPRYFS